MVCCDLITFKRSFNWVCYIWSSTPPKNNFLRFLVVSAAAWEQKIIIMYFLIRFTQFESLKLLLWRIKERSGSTKNCTLDRVKKKTIKTKQTASSLLQGLVWNTDFPHWLFFLWLALNCCFWGNIWKETCVQKCLFSAFCWISALKVGQKFYNLTLGKKKSSSCCQN